MTMSSSGTTSRARHSTAASSQAHNKSANTNSNANASNNSSDDEQHEHDKKYSKTSKGKNTSNNSTMSRVRFWIWMICGAVCSFYSIDVSFRALFRSATMGQQQYYQATILPQTLSKTWEDSTTLRPLRDLTSDYAFDSTLAIKPDPQQHAILIPYRDRHFHLQLFLEYMGPWLHHHFPHAHFTLWIIEQDDAELFNRAWLANVGLREIVARAPQTSCVIFHDVDLVPNMTSHVPYTTCQYPMQLGSELQHFNWTVPYPAYCGGITSLSLKHWQLINGLGNDYIGWGGEDDDLYHRLRANGLLAQPEDKTKAPHPHRPPPGRGVFRTISQAAQHHEQKKTHNQYWKTLELLKEMGEGSDRWKFDGMTDVYYTITQQSTQRMDLGFENYHHIKAIPQKLRDGKVVYHKNINADEKAKLDNKDDEKPVAPLEFVHVPLTGGQAITKAAADAGFVWGACHFGAFAEWNCPPGHSGDYQHAPMRFKASFAEAQKPWLIPLYRFLENPMEGTKRFTIVRHPYSRAISFYRYTYDQQHGYPFGFKYHSMVANKDHPPLDVAQYIREREHPEKMNAFLQEYLIRQHHPHKPDGIELIPQVQYVYYRGAKYVHHVLHYEFINRDFKTILEKYEMTGMIDLPPPERKRKRKKQYVKKYFEKRIPKATTSWTSSLGSSPLRLLGLAGDNNGDAQEMPVVDMSLAEIEDEYLLGAQDLANETIAMLNTHFELDFRKFHYAKIKVNISTDQYWSPVQIIPRDSSVAKQQSDRNYALNKAKGGGNEEAAAAAKAGEDADKKPKQEGGESKPTKNQEPAKKPPNPASYAKRLKQYTAKNNHEAHAVIDKLGGAHGHDLDAASAAAELHKAAEETVSKEDPLYKVRKARMMERLQKDEKGDPKLNMREVAEALRGRENGIATKE